MMRGGVILVNLEDATPPEFGKVRPAIIVSNDEHNHLLATLMVVPLSTRPPAIWPLRLELPEVAGLRKSYAVVPGMRQISKARVVEQVAQVPVIFMRELLAACMAYLDE